MQDGEEPAIADAEIQLREDTGKIVCEAVTGTAGDYKLEGAKESTYRLHIGADKKFRFTCRSPDELNPITDDYHVLLSGTTVMNIGLMQGFLALPFSSDTRYHIDRYYDWDPSRTTYLWWNGQRGSERSQGGTVNHPGTDYGIDVGIPLLSAAPGVVSAIAMSDGVKYVYVNHGYNFSTAYDHVSKVFVSEGQRVIRGERIALSGQSGATYSHLHFDLRYPDFRRLMDPYKPMFDVTPDMMDCLSITGTGQTAWVADPLGIVPNGRGYWTKENDPVFPVANTNTMSTSTRPKNLTRILFQFLPAAEGTWQSSCLHPL